MYVCGVYVVCVSVRCEVYMVCVVHVFVVSVCDLWCAVSVRGGCGVCGCGCAVGVVYRVCVYG